MAEDTPEEQIELDPVVVVARITTLEMLVRQMMVVQLRLLAGVGVPPVQGNGHHVRPFVSAHQPGDRATQALNVVAAHGGAPLHVLILGD